MQLEFIFADQNSVKKKKDHLNWFNYFYTCNLSKFAFTKLSREMVENAKYPLNEPIGFKKWLFPISTFRNFIIYIYIYDFLLSVFRHEKTFDIHFMLTIINKNIIWCQYMIEICPFIWRLFNVHLKIQWLISIL